MYFFGDSWSAESGEYNSIMKQDFDSYPTMIGKLLGQSICNCSLPGSSQEHMIVQFLSSKIKAGDHAVFSLTTPSRRMYYNDNNEICHLFVDSNKDGINDYNDQWRSSNALTVLYHLCMSKNIKPWFICTFNVTCVEDYGNQLWSTIPDDCWLLPKNQCVIEKIFDPEYFNKYDEFKNSDFQEWLDTENSKVQTYIRPCVNHPNLEGRKIIAQTIANIITLRSNLTIKGELL